MALPLEFLPYAENLYRRFPEEFLALGAPGLEEVFDLRASGTRSRRILETPTEKTVEITFRRWQSPIVGPAPGLHPQAWLPQAAYPTHPGTAVSSPQYAGVAQSPPAVLAPPAVDADEQSTARLIRLESALAALKPQIEAVLKAQARANAQLQQCPNNTPAGVQPEAGATVSASSAARDSDAEARRVEVEVGADGNRRMRAHQMALTQLQIGPVRPEATGGRHPAVVKLDSITGEDEQADTSKLVDGSAKAGEKQRPGMKINRIMSADLDPGSPRSPGPFSAWG
eukprot:CAMPEP_0194509736 /NCGR_PEP_ID=MMETSP0253-20130528/40775_1 /TAXON_ID=2966 /ORGANISM="Noctiluca scintillans" /LENGTH=283 /DNA_ID=CAMNT_0039352921 /DNA_START=35 /DNA_END=886 /DNA_ORIENTATION=+